MTMQSSFTDFDFSHMTAAERLLLAQELLDSVYDAVVPGVLSQPQADELHRRRDDLLSGNVQGVPWEQVRPALLDRR